MKIPGARHISTFDYSNCTQSSARCNLPSSERLRGFWGLAFGRFQRCGFGVLPAFQKRKYPPSADRGPRTAPSCLLCCPQLLVAPDAGRWALPRRCSYYEVEG